ncbi:MAG: TlpA family protein disulfide reductase, partial [Microthrixaceae bacterium]
PRSRWRQPRVVVIGAVVVVAVGVIAAIGLAGLSEPRVNLVTSTDDGDTAPLFALGSLVDENSIITLADHAGTPVLVNFWASWCVPCRREMPALETIHREFAGRVDFIGINHQDDRDDALALVAETGITYPSAYDPRGATAVDYNLFGMPTTVFITADGRIAGRHTGELTEADLRTALEDLVAS